jgi:DNA-binding MarR family transcriptional regulator
LKTQHRREMEDLFVYLCHYHRENNYPPTLREMADTFYMSPSTVLRYLDKMQATGWIAREWGKARGITLLRTCGPAETTHAQPK